MEVEVGLFSSGRQKKRQLARFSRSRSPLCFSSFSNQSNPRLEWSQVAPTGHVVVVLTILALSHYPEWAEANLRAISLRPPTPFCFSLRGSLKCLYASLSTV